MKKVFIILLFSQVLPKFSICQEIFEGWYYLPDPASNLWGIGYHRPLEGKTLIYSGAMTHVISSQDLISQTGPKMSEKILSKLNSFALTSLFQNNNAVSFSITSYQLKQDLLQPYVYKDLDDGNYYVTQALRADSVTIKGKIDKTKGGNSQDAQTLISGFAKTGTAILNVVDLLTGKDSTKPTKIVSYSKTKSDSFTIVISDPEVYFAVKLTKVDFYDPSRDNVERGKSNESISILYDDDPIDIISAHYEINKGLDVGVRFIESAGNATAEVYQKYTGNADIILATKTRQLNNKPIHFKIEGWTTTPIVGEKKNKSSNMIITGIASFIYDPNKKEIYIDGLDDNNKFQTAVYHAEGTYTSWPSK